MAWFTKRLERHLGITPDSKGVKGFFDGNPLARDAMEFAKMAKIDFSVNCMLNEKADIVAIFAGDIEKAYEPAVVAAKEHYRFLIPVITISQSPMHTVRRTRQLSLWYHLLLQSKRTGGSAVTIANSHLGQVVHYLSGSWGTNAVRRIGVRDQFQPGLITVFSIVSFLREGTGHYGQTRI